MPRPALPEVQARAARRWLEARQADLLPLDYYHVVFALPPPISAIAYYNKAVLYDLLFEVAAGRCALLPLTRSISARRSV